MEQNTFTMNDYIEMVRMDERIRTLKRMYESGSYVGDKDIKAILGIGEEQADG